MLNLTRTFGITALVCFGLSAQAFAHSELKSATPAEGGTVATSPSELDLKFSEDLNLKFSGVTVTGPNKTAVQTGEATLTDGNTTLVVPIAGVLGAGIYTVTWHALSADSHKSHGSYTFTVKP
jgi:methionine-rich copper-binding protein CopC